MGELERDSSRSLGPNSPDLPERSERYIAVVDPYWNSLKDDIKANIEAFNRQPGRPPVLLEDAGALLLVDGDGYGVKVRLQVERERLHVSYSALSWRKGPLPKIVILRAAEGIAAH